MGTGLAAYQQPDYVTCIDLGGSGAIFTRGWERPVLFTGAVAKRLKEQVNRYDIYPPVASAQGSPVRRSGAGARRHAAAVGLGAPAVPDRASRAAPGRAAGPSPRGVRAVARLDRIAGSHEPSPPDPRPAQRGSRRSTRWPTPPTGRSSGSPGSPRTSTSRSSRRRWTRPPPPLTRTRRARRWRLLWRPTAVTCFRTPGTTGSSVRATGCEAEPSPPSRLLPACSTRRTRIRPLAVTGTG